MRGGRSVGRPARRPAAAVAHVVTAARAGRRTDTVVPLPGLRADLNLAVVVGDDAVDDRQPEAAALARTCRGTAGRGRRAPRAGCRSLRRAPSARRRRPGSTRAVRRSRPPSGMARRPLVARFQTICLICPSSASYQSSCGGTSTSIACPSCTSALLRSSSAASLSARRTSNRAIETLRPRVRQKRSDRRVQPLRLAQHDVHQLFLLGAERQLLPQDLNRAGHRRQRIADLVRDAGRHLADRRQPLLDRARRARAS